MRQRHGVPGCDLAELQQRDSAFAVIFGMCEELVKSIEDLREKREELNRQILKDGMRKASGEGLRSSHGDVLIFNYI